MSNYSEQFIFDNDIEIRERNTNTDSIVSPAFRSIKDLNDFIKKDWFNNFYNKIERIYDLRTNFHKSNYIQYRFNFAHYISWLLNYWELNINKEKEKLLDQLYKKYWLKKWELFLDKNTAINIGKFYKECLSKEIFFK